MKFDVSTSGQGTTGIHRTRSTQFISAEHQMGGDITNPNPLELLLGSLTGCMNVILQMIAQRDGWQDVTATYHAVGDLDPRGMMGDETVPPYFQSVYLEVSVQNIPEVARRSVMEEVGRRCPVHRLMEQAGVKFDEHWRIS